MASIVKRTEFDPFAILREPFGTMREWLRPFEPFRELYGRRAGEREAWTFVPEFDVLEKKDAYLFKADLPGIKEEDLDISIYGNRLTVSGKREMEKKEEAETWYCYERGYGSFTRTFTLPEGVDAERVRAELRDGVLSLAVPKKPEAQPKKISVKEEKKAIKA
jgi:HSP20 family protein